MKAGRKRNNLGSEVEARIALGVKRGETAEQISKAIGGATSRATVSRRMRELRGPVQAPRHTTKPSSPKAKSADPPLPTSPKDIPTDADLPALNALLERCNAALSKAEKGENLTLVGQMIRVAASLSETIRKATPPKQPDPNEAPDMIALRVEAARKWHEMVKLVADDT